MSLTNNPDLAPLILLFTSLAALIVIIIYCWCADVCNNFFYPINTDDFSKKWNRIETLSNDANARPLAVIYACSLLDDALKKRGYGGETLQRRFDVSRSFFSSGDRVRRALELRNHFAHSGDIIELSTYVTEIEDALSAIRSELVSLRALK